tara:strand:- start:31 stop:225 length:195 start_codon:yes stop_codon:yes gene_type:complete
MFFEDAQDAWEMFRISPELTCTCDEVHTCQQCYEEDKQLCKHKYQDVRYGTSRCVICGEEEQSF